MSGRRVPDRNKPQLYVLLYHRFRKAFKYFVIKLPANRGGDGGLDGGESNVTLFEASITLAEKLIITGGFVKVTTHH